MIYVTSDIHGEYDLFLKLLKEISFNPAEDKLYILGDVIDRGKKPIEILRYIVDNQNSIILLKGNHEAMMIDAVNFNDYGNWFYNGGRIVYDQYIKLPQDEQNKLFKFIDDLPVIHQLDIDNKKYILSHAGVETDHNGYILSQQDQDFMLWAREEFLYGTEITNDVTVIVGHTPTINIHGNDIIWHSKCGKKICIDCGAVFGYKLACLRLNDMKEFYVSKEE